MDGSGFQYFDIIFFAMVAGFLILRLRSVLGRRTGEENPERWRPRPPTPPGAPAPEAREPGRLPGASTPPSPQPAPTSAAPAPAAEIAGTPAETGLNQIRLADRAFTPQGFVQGARSAFEMIVGAFALGDTATLRPLLNDEVYDQFSAAIRERLQRKHTHETTLIAIKSADIIEARMEGRDALVTVKFVTEQVNVTRDAAGAVIDGDPNRVATVTDIWTFSRNTRSSNPNWLLVATASPQ
jgi:predicted lipid-binding transport protein (Tim44 family)